MSRGLVVHLWFVNSEKTQFFLLILWVPLVCTLRWDKRGMCIRREL